MFTIDSVLEEVVHKFNVKVRDAIAAETLKLRERIVELERDKVTIYEGLRNANEKISALTTRLEIADARVDIMDKDSDAAFTKVSADIHNILGQLNKLDHETDMTVNNLANRLDAQEIKAMSHGDAARLFKLEEAVQELRYQVERGDEEMLDEDSVREMIDDHNMDKLHFEDADDFRGTVRQALMEILKGGEE